MVEVEKNRLMELISRFIKWLPKIAKKDMAEKRSWSDIPQDVLNIICSNVFHQSPLLMSLINGSQWKFFHPVFEYTFNENYPELTLEHSTWTPDRIIYINRISSSKFGWLLFDEGDGRLQFFNPFTYESFDIPGMENFGFELFHFSSPPTSPDCTIVAMKNSNINSNDIGIINSDIDDYKHIHGTEIGIIKRGKKDWTILPPFDSGGMFNNAVFIDGRCYFVGDELNVGIFDIMTNEWKVYNNHKLPRIKRGLYRTIGMVEYNGGFMVVYESPEYQQLHLARYDLSKMKWEKVDYLGDDKVLYVSEYGCYLETIVAKGMGNKIYIPKIYGGKSVFYCLATNKYFSSDGKYYSKQPYNGGLVLPRFCTWIKPDYSMTDVEHVPIPSNIMKDMTEEEISDLTYAKWTAKNLGEDESEMVLTSDWIDSMTK